MKRFFVALLLFCLSGVALAQWQVPDFRFMTALSRGKTYVTAPTDRCGFQIWTNTATGLVTFIQAGIEGAACGAPKVDNYDCNQDQDPKKCYFCRRNTDNLCDSASLDANRRLVVCSNGDFQAAGVRYTLYPYDPTRFNAACVP